MEIPRSTCFLLLSALLSQCLLSPASSSTFQDEKNFYFPPFPSFGSPPIVPSPPLVTSTPPPAHGTDPGGSGSTPPSYGGGGSGGSTPPSYGGGGSGGSSPPLVTSTPPPAHGTVPGGSGSTPPSYGGGGSGGSSPPSHGSGGSTPPAHHTPSHGGSSGSHHHHHGSPPTNCGIPPPPKHVNPSHAPPTHHDPSPAPPTGTYHYYPPPSSSGGSPTVPSNPPIILPPTTPGIPFPSPPFDPNSPPIGGTCDFWRNHPGMIWGLFGWWGQTVGGAFGVATLPGTGAHLNLLQALSNTRTDGIGALYREGTASLLNSMVNKNFPFTTSHVKDSFVAAMGSKKAAAAQARVFKLANEGHMKKLGV